MATEPRALQLNVAARVGAFGGPRWGRAATKAAATKAAATKAPPTRAATKARFEG